MELSSLTYEVTGRIARITLNRPERGNAIDERMPAELAACVERADLDQGVHVIALSGNGRGFCGGYDLERWAASLFDERGGPELPALRAVVENHRPDRVWDPMLDFQWMRRCGDAFMSLHRADKPTVVKVHGFCVAGGTDIALCADLMVAAVDCKIGYPPARVWGIPSTGLWAHRLGDQRAKRLLFTGDCLSGAEAADWGLAVQAAEPERLDEAFEALLARIALVPRNQLIAAKLSANQAFHAGGPYASQTISTLLDGVARHTSEGYAFQQRAAEVGHRQAVRERDEPFGDAGRSTYKGPPPAPSASGG